MTSRVPSGTLGSVDVQHGRWTADVEGDFVVFLIGAAVHDPEVSAEVGGLTVRLGEMLGAPGDLILMHPAIVHGAAPNTASGPRMMLTEWIVRRGAMDGAPPDEG